TGVHADRRARHADADGIALRECGGGEAGDEAGDEQGRANHGWSSVACRGDPRVMSATGIGSAVGKKAGRPRPSLRTVPAPYRKGASEVMTHGAGIFLDRERPVNGDVCPACGNPSLRARSCAQATRGFRKGQEATKTPATRQQVALLEAEVRHRVS